MTARALAFTESPPGISTAASRVRRGSEIITGITDIALVSTNGMDENRKTFRQRDT